jgi:tetratricopeptide (TPR) repeat protein
MLIDSDSRFDFFLSRRGSVASIALEVADVLSEKGYKICVQDYDFPIGGNLLELMHLGIKKSRDLIVLYTHDYERSPYTRKEFTSFLAEQLQSFETRRIIVLCCDVASPSALLADVIRENLHGITDPADRKRRIIAAAEGQTAAVRPPPRPFVGVPPEISGFIGRSEEFDRLDKILLTRKPAAAVQVEGRAAVHGLGGMGKTALAAEYARRYRSLFGGVWWCPAETRDGLLTSLSSLGVTLGVVTAEESNIEKAARTALNRLAEMRATWLLVYDNAKSPEEIADYLPAAGASLLITSRFSDWSRWAIEVPLDVLSISDAGSLLLRRTDRNDDYGSKRLAAVLGQLPLALDQAAATCRMTQLSFSEYANKIEQFLADKPDGTIYPRSVAATFDVAISSVTDRYPMADDIIAVIGNCAPERIPLALIRGANRSKALMEFEARLMRGARPRWLPSAVWKFVTKIAGDLTSEEDVEFRHALTALVQVSLIKHDPFENGTPAISAHRVVQAIARTRSTLRGLAHRIIENLVASMRMLYPDDGLLNTKSWPLCAQLTPHVFELRSSVRERLSNSVFWSDVLNCTGVYLEGRAVFKEARLLLEEALSIRERKLGPEHPAVATSLNNIGVLVESMAKLDEARAVFERSLAIREKILGPNHPHTAITLHNLGRIFRDMGDLAKARHLMERALAIRESALGPDDPQLAISFDGLAAIHSADGNYRNARSLYERSLAIREKNFGVSDARVTAALVSIARVLHEQGDLSGSKVYSERALAIYDQTYGRDHPNTASTLGDLGHLHHRLGNRAEAESFLAEGHAINERHLGFAHANTQASLRDLANVVLHHGNSGGAVALYARALRHCENTLGSEHRSTILILEDFACLLRDSGALPKARLHMTRVLAFYEKYDGKEHPQTNCVRGCLAEIFLRSGHLRRGLALGKLALANHSKVLGHDHPWTIESANITADCFDALGQSAMAVSLRNNYKITKQLAF